MSRITWDGFSERSYQHGVDRGVLYPQQRNRTYAKGVAWNGLTNIDKESQAEDPETLRAFGMPYDTVEDEPYQSCTITAYTYPDEFNRCLGYSTPYAGLSVDSRMDPKYCFGLCYRSWIGNADRDDAGYLLHVLYGCKLKPASFERETDGKDIEAMEFEFECDMLPEEMTLFENPLSNFATSHTGDEDFNLESRRLGYLYHANELIIDSRYANPYALKAVEEILYGSDVSEPTLVHPRLLCQMLDVPAYKIVANVEHGKYVGHQYISQIIDLGSEVRDILYGYVTPGIESHGQYVGVMGYIAPDEGFYLDPSTVATDVYAGGLKVANYGSALYIYKDRTENLGIKGDIDCDGRITIRDVIAAKRLVGTTYSATNPIHWRMDVDNNQTLDIYDVHGIAQMASLDQKVAGTDIGFAIACSSTGERDYYLEPNRYGTSVIFLRPHRLDPNDYGQTAQLI